MEIRDIVIEIVATELDVDNISEASSLEELGADSVHLVELALAIEERFGINISDAALGRFRTVDDLINYVRSRAGRRFRDS